MMRSIIAMSLSAALLLVACGGSSDDDNPLAKWAGGYEIFETFSNQSGDCVGQPSSSIYQGDMQVRIDGNAIDCDLDRWGHIKGELRENGSVLASLSLGASESVNLSGSFDEADAFAGNLRHVKDGCTRNWQVDGSRPEAGQ